MRRDLIALTAAAVFSLQTGDAESAGVPKRPRSHRAARDEGAAGLTIHVEERTSGLVYVAQFDDDPVPLVGATGVNGTIIPLYTRPSDESWGSLVAAKRAHPAVPTIAIINPADGPGPAPQAEYVAGIGRLTSAGVRVIGYVHTLYGRRAASAVEAEIDRYRAWYPGLTGIFFDEMASTPGFESYYEARVAYARSRGSELTVANPGTGVPPSYLGSADILIISETSGLPQVSLLSGRIASRASLAALCYGVPVVDRPFIAAVRPFVGYIYLQSDILPNPWDSVPRYLPELLAALD
jgi:hypothetical protein